MTQFPVEIVLFLMAIVCIGIYRLLFVGQTGRFRRGLVMARQAASEELISALRARAAAGVETVDEPWGWLVFGDDEVLMRAFVNGAPTGDWRARIRVAAVCMVRIDLRTETVEFRVPWDFVAFMTVWSGGIWMMVLVERELLYVPIALIFSGFGWFFASLNLSLQRPAFEAALFALEDVEPS